MPKEPEAPKNEFTTIKVREHVRRWIKSEAALKGVPMYDYIEQILAKGVRGRPWEKLELRA